MKNLSIMFLAFVLIFSSCKKDEDTEDQQPDGLTPEKVQWGLAINYTATWCGPCGEWGSPLIHELADAGDVVAITVHVQGDPMFNPVLYNSFNADRSTGGSIPAFWIGDTKTTNVDVMNTLLGQTPKAGIAIEAKNNDTTMTVKTRTEFFEEGSGDYFLSVLILEDGINGSSSAGDYKQNGAENPASYKHDFVLRASGIVNNSYGEQIATGPEKGATIDREYEIILQPAWGNVYAVAILWQVGLSGSPNYKFVNAVK